MQPQTFQPMVAYAPKLQRRSADPPLAGWRNKDPFLNKNFLLPLCFILLTLYLLKRLGGVPVVEFIFFLELTYKIFLEQCSPFLS